MRFQNTKIALTTGALIALLMGSATATAQSKGKSKARAKAPVKASSESEQQKPSEMVVAPVSTPVSGEKTDKVDISDLENKYWAPKDTDFSVVQNRTYTKEGKIGVALQGGMLVNDGYSDGWTYGGSLNYFFSERYGMEATYVVADLKDNDSTSSLVSFAGGVKPDYGRMTDYYGVSFNWVPFYAKMSVMGKKIIYFDMAFSPAVGMMGYEQVTESGTKAKSAFAYGFDVTQYFFLSQNFSLRFDLKNRWYKEDIAKYYNTGGIAEGQTFRSTERMNTQLMLGVNFFF